MGIRGNGLRHYVRLGKIREIESEFSKIGVRMTKIWPREVSRKIQIQNRFKNFNFQKWREKSRQTQGVDWGVDLPTRSTGESTLV